MSKRLYDEQSLAYRRARRAHADVRLALLDIGLPDPSARVLDIGCGTFRETGYLADYCELVVGIDASFDMMDLAKLGRACRVSADFNDPLPLAADTFSHVLLISSAHHAHDPVSLLAEASRVARAKSKIMIVSHTPEQILSRPTYDFFPGLALRSAARFPSPMVLGRALQALGYQVEISDLEREPIPIDDAFLARFAERAFDSALMHLSDKAWELGLARIRRAVQLGANLHYPRTRLLLKATRG